MGKVEIRQLIMIMETFHDINVTTWQNFGGCSLQTFDYKYTEYKCLSRRKDFKGSSQTQEQNEQAVHTPGDAYNLFIREEFVSGTGCSSDPPR